LIFTGVFTAHVTVQGHPADGEFTVASLTDLRRSSSLESFGVFSLGGRRATVAGLASGSRLGRSVIGVVGVELVAGFSSFTAGSVEGTGAGAGAGAACSGAGAGVSWLGVAVGGCSSCGGGLGSVVLAGSRFSVGLGAGGGVDT